MEEVEEEKKCGGIGERQIPVLQFDATAVCGDPGEGFRSATTIHRFQYHVEGSHVATPVVGTALSSAVARAGLLCSHRPLEQRRKQMPVARTARSGIG